MVYGRNRTLMRQIVTFLGILKLWTTYYSLNYYFLLLSWKIQFFAKFLAKNCTPARQSINFFMNIENRNLFMGLFKLFFVLLLQNIRLFQISYCSNRTSIGHFVNFSCVFEMRANLWDTIDFCTILHLCCTWWFNGANIFVKLISFYLLNEVNLK